MSSPLSATSPRRRLGIAIAALATAAAVALPAQAIAAPSNGGTTSGVASASYAAGKSHGAEVSKRKHHSRSHRNAKKAAKHKSGKPQTSKPQTGGSNAGSGGASAPATPPASGTPSGSKPPRSTPKPPATTPPPATTTPPVTTTPAPPATTPAPPATGTTPPNSELLFSGSRIRDFAMLQAAPNAITEVPDPLGGGESVLKMTVNDGDVAPITPTENPRAQAISPDIINQGQEFWLSAKFLIPAEMPTVPGWMSLISVYGAPYAGSSPWCIGIAGNNLEWDRNASYNWDTPWKAPLVKGQWTTLLVHERFASDGFIEMWINGTPVTFFANSATSYNPSRQAATQHLAMKTVDSSNGGAANSVRISQYRQKGMFESASVYWGGVKVGTSRTAVGG